MSIWDQGCAKMVVLPTHPKEMFGLVHIVWSNPCIVCLAKTGLEMASFTYDPWVDWDRPCSKGVSLVGWFPRILLPTTQPQGLLLFFSHFFVWYLFQEWQSSSETNLQHVNNVNHRHLAVMLHITPFFVVAALNSKPPHFSQLNQKDSKVCR